MKFNDVKNISEGETKKVVINQKQTELNIQKNVIDYMFRYGNVGVYIMKNGKKGLFREMASYINDGVTPTSWALKISNSDGWSIQFGINPNADFSTNDIYLGEILSIFEKKYDNVNVNGNNKVVLISGVASRHEAEEISNYIIKTFKDIELDFNDMTIYQEFNIEESIKPLRIIGFYAENKIDEQSHKKFISIVEKLSPVKMSLDDTVIFKKIKAKISIDEILTEGDRLQLNDLMKDYLSTHDRVSIAMKYLNKE